MQVIAKNYDYLHERCRTLRTLVYTDYEYDDIFHDAILFVTLDVKAIDIINDKDILEHFCFRFRMIEFDYAHKKKKLKEVDYANDKQTKEELSEGW